MNELGLFNFLEIDIFYEISLIVTFLCIGGKR